MVSTVSTNTNTKQYATHELSNGVFEHLQTFLDHQTLANLLLDVRWGLYNLNTLTITKENKLIRHG